MKKKGKWESGLLMQIAMLFIAGIIATEILSYFSQYEQANERIIEQTELNSSRAAQLTEAALKEYPAYRWLVGYWHDHASDMDIEYDADYSAGTRTEEKTRILSEHQPDLQIKYADTGTVEALPEEDKKLYAEVAYSWLITRINQIKLYYDIDYLFCVMTDDTYREQFFLFSAADPDSVRGTQYEEVYPLGTLVSVAGSTSQMDAMRYASANSSHLADAGDYVDYYSYVDTVGENHVLIGITTNLTGMTASIIRQTRYGTLYVTVLEVFLALICLLMVNSFVLKPLKKVQRNIRHYKSTKDSSSVVRDLSQLKLKNEIGILAEDVVSMVGELDDYLEKIEKITAERERIDAELSLAARIQDSTLPNDFPAFPDRNDFDIYASMKPAKEVGGDFYDFFMVDDDHLALIIADVSGKGVPAALFMTFSMILLHTVVSYGISPAEALKSVNRQITLQNREDMFVTIWLGILDVRTGRITAANAGHEYPALKQPDGHFEIFYDKHGFIIGGLEDVNYTEYEFTMKPGSKLFLYTDGLPESMNAESELFGMDRALEAVRKYEDGSPQQILEGVDSEIREFIGECDRFDDLTMLCVHYIGPATDRTDG